MSSFHDHHAASRRGLGGARARQHAAAVRVSLVAAVMLLACPRALYHADGKLVQFQDLAPEHATRGPDNRTFAVLGDTTAKAPALWGSECFENEGTIDVVVGFSDRAVPGSAAYAPKLQVLLFAEGAQLEKGVSSAAAQTYAHTHTHTHTRARAHTRIRLRTRRAHMRCKSKNVSRPTPKGRVMPPSVGHARSLCGTNSSVLHICGTLRLSVCLVAGTTSVKGAVATVSHNVHSTIDHNWFTFGNESGFLLSDSHKGVRHTSGALRLRVRHVSGSAEAAWFVASQGWHTLDDYKHGSTLSVSTAAAPACSKLGVYLAPNYQQVSSLRINYIMVQQDTDGDTVLDDDETLLGAVFWISSPPVPFYYNRPRCPEQFEVLKLCQFMI